MHGIDFVQRVKGADYDVTDTFSRLLPSATVEPYYLDDHTYGDDNRLKLEGFHIVRIGNQCVTKFTVALRKGLNWPNKREHVKRFIRSCPCCLKMCYLKPAIHMIPFKLAANAPMDRI